MSRTPEKCPKINCTLEAGHEGWHIKKGARGKIIIQWLDGKWKSPDGSHGTYRYVEKAEVAVIQDMEVPQFPPYTGDYEVDERLALGLAEDYE